MVQLSPVDGDAESVQSTRGVADIKSASGEQGETQSEHRRGDK